MASFFFKINALSPVLPTISWTLNLDNVSPVPLAALLALVPHPMSAISAIFKTAMSSVFLLLAIRVAPLDCITIPRLTLVRVRM